MRSVALLGLLAACHHAPPRAEPEPRESHRTRTPVEDDASARLARSLRVAELHPDGRALILSETRLEAGARYDVGALQTFDDADLLLVWVTVEIDEPVEGFLDANATTTFHVCPDSRTGKPPPLYRAHVVDVMPGGMPRAITAVAWPTSEELVFEHATRSVPPVDPDALPMPDGAVGTRIEAEEIELDGDGSPERLLTGVALAPPTRDCPFPFVYISAVADWDGKIFGVSEEQADCFSHVPLHHDEMACCEFPVCTADDARAECAWPPAEDAAFVPDLRPAGFSARPFVANLVGPVRAALRGSNGIVWIRELPRFEGERFRFEYLGPDRVERIDTYVYRCEYAATAP